MSKELLNLSLGEIEAIIVSAYEANLIAKGALTDKQAENAEYSYAIPEIRLFDTEEGPEERRKRFHDFVLSVVQGSVIASNSWLKEKICDHLQYCKMRDHEAIGIIATTLDGVISSQFGLPIPAATLAAWLIKSGWLDRLCGCVKKSG